MHLCARAHTEGSAGSPRPFYMVTYAHAECLSYHLYGPIIQPKGVRKMRVTTPRDAEWSLGDGSNSCCGACQAIVQVSDPASRSASLPLPERRAASSN